MKKKTLIIILILVITLILALSILGLLYLINNNKLNTYIYDGNNNEIAVINYADVSFFDKVKSYYLASALENILNDIMKKENISEDEAEKLLSTGGYKIYLCVDSDEQNKIEKIYKDDTNFSENIESSTIVLDNNTGEVKAVVGGRNKEDKAITFGEYNKTNNVWAKNVNNATETKLQPGSALTLLSVYACGLESGKITLESIYSDKPSGDFSNSGITFHGDITVKEAIKLYSNYIALTIAQELGIDTCYNFVKSLGINLDEQNDKNIANISLGGLKEGVTLSEIAVANRAILNDGIYKEPIYYTKILDKKNNIYLQKEQKQNSVVKSNVCEDLRNCLVQTINDKTVYIRVANPIHNREKWCTLVTDKYTYSSVIYNIKLESIDTDKNEAKELLEKLI